MLDFKADKRDIVRKGGLNALREKGVIPAVVYGKGFDTIPVTVDTKKFNKVIRVHGENTLLNLELEGEVYPVLIREVQRDPIRGEIIHVDFNIISMTEEIDFELPVVLVGEPAGAAEGGVLQHQLRELDAKALPKYMIDTVEVDVSDLEIGDTVLVRDLDIDENITILDDPEEMIATLLAPEEEEEEEELDEDELDDVAEPEVIEKGKTDEEEEEAEE